MRLFGKKSVFLVLSGLLAANLLIFTGGRFIGQADAGLEIGNPSVSDVQIFPIQLGREIFGIAMIDTIGQTLWVYQVNLRGPAHEKLKLVAARSYEYDRMLKQYNTAEPKPEQVRLMLEKLGFDGIEQSPENGVIEVLDNVDSNQ